MVRQQRGLEVERPQIAVLVQMLVESVASAVVFSANPITGMPINEAAVSELDAGVFNVCRA